MTLIVNWAGEINDRRLTAQSGQTPKEKSLFLHMQFIEGSFYHIYNRGNNKNQIFFQERNYLYFLEKIKKYITPNSNLLAWCLMPNHFHFLVRATASSTKIVKQTPIKISSLVESIRLLLSSYTQGIQKQEGFTGSLFQQKTKSKNVDSYLSTAFHYIHQNPLRAGMVKRLEEYPWTSFSEYAEKMKFDRRQTAWSGQTPIQICNQEVAIQFMDIRPERFMAESYAVISDDVMKMIES